MKLFRELVLSLWVIFVLGSISAEDLPKYNLAVNLFGLQPQLPVYISIYKKESNKDLKKDPRNRFVDLTPYTEQVVNPETDMVLAQFSLPKGKYQIVAMQDLDDSAKESMEFMVSTGDLTGEKNIRIEGNQVKTVDLVLEQTVGVTNKEQINDFITNQDLSKIKPSEKQGQVRVHVTDSVSSVVYLLFFKDPEAFAYKHPIMLLRKSPPSFTFKVQKNENGELKWKGELPKGRYCLLIYEDTDGIQPEFDKQPVTLPSFGDQLGFFVKQRVDTDSSKSIHTDTNPFEFQVRSNRDREIPIDMHADMKSILTDLHVSVQTLLEFYHRRGSDEIFTPPDFSNCYGGRVETSGFVPGCPDSVCGEGGFPLYNARVTLTFDDGSITRSARTDGTGGFWICDVPPAFTMTARVELNGFEIYEQTFHEEVPPEEAEHYLDYGTIFPMHIALTPLDGKQLIAGKLADEFREELISTPVELHISLDETLSWSIAITRTNGEGLFYFLADPLEELHFGSVIIQPQYTISVRPFRRGPHDFIGGNYDISIWTFTFDSGVEENVHGFIHARTVDIARFRSFSESYRLRFRILNKNERSIIYERNWLNEPWIAPGILSDFATGLHAINKEFIFRDLGRTTQFRYYETELLWRDHEPRLNVGAHADRDDDGYRICFRNELHMSTTIHEIGHILDYFIVNSNRISPPSSDFSPYSFSQLRTFRHQIYCNVNGIITEPCFSNDTTMDPLPPGFLSDYSTLTNMENFADHFMFFIISPSSYFDQMGVTRV